jgi:hypothetical protein
MSAIPPFVIHIFAAVQDERRRRPCGPRFGMPDGFDPKSASVRTKQPTILPVAIPGRYFSFCSSEPYA